MELIVLVAVVAVQQIHHVVIIQLLVDLVTVDLVTMDLAEEDGGSGSSYYSSSLDGAVMDTALVDLEIQDVDVAVNVKAADVEVRNLNHVVDATITTTTITIAAQAVTDCLVVDHGGYSY